MLQQTTVAAVIRRFERFLQRWPTVEALAQASDSDVLGEWAGLGYYARARNMISCARKVADRGSFPTTEVELRALPGIGDYTAAAIAAIAVERNATVVDTNVARVVARLNGIDRPLADVGAEIRSLAAEMTPSKRPGDYAQAMMDLGATICRPTKPDCLACPVAMDCQAFASGSPESFPARKARRERPRRFGIAWWVERKGHVWLVRRPQKGMLGGMAALPGPEWTDEQPAAASLTFVRHSFTHFTLDLHIVACAEPSAEGWWHPIDQLSEAGLPTLYARAAEAMAERSDAIAA